MTKLAITFLLLTIATAHAADSWKITPKLYSRAGITQSLDLDARGSTNMQNWNPGSWGEESNAFMKNLTEADLHAMYGDKAKIVYGVNIDESERFTQDGGSTEYKERQAYITFFNAINNIKGSELWVGRRPYRGFGDYLTGVFPLDERNMMGAGFIVPVGKAKYEFAYALNDQDGAESTIVDNATHTDTDDYTTTTKDENYTTNIFINKYITPIENGNVTINAEIHQNNAKDAQYESYGAMLGGQYAKWDMKLLDAKWYNIFVLNYANGYTGGVEAGVMHGPFTVRNKDERANKVLFKIGGDLKAKKWAAYYTVKYQWHKGDLKDSSNTYGDQLFSFLDIHARPMYAVSSNVGLGIDYVQRFVVDEPTSSEADAMGKAWTREQNMHRVGVIGTYHMLEGASDIFRNCEVSLIAGIIKKEKQTDFFQGRDSSKSANFVRLKYTMEIW